MTKGNKCPDCDTLLVAPSDSSLGEIISCPTCGLELEITSLHPLNLKELVLEGEDWGE